MTKDEALDLALEALETCEVVRIGTRFKSKYFAEDEVKAAITALKQALAADVQEPVATLFGSLPVYDTPPEAQRQWVGLTDDEFEDIELRCRSTPFGKIEAMQKVEAKLKEKNT